MRQFCEVFTYFQISSSFNFLKISCNIKLNIIVRNTRNTCLRFFFSGKKSLVEFYLDYHHMSKHVFETISRMLINILSTTNIVLTLATKIGHTTF